MSLPKPLFPRLASPRFVLLERLATQSSVRIALISALLTVLVAVFFFAPRFWLWRVVGLPLDELISIQPEIHRAYFALSQLADPWMRIENSVNRVIEWRLLFPAIAHYLQLPHWLYLALPHAGCFLALAAISAIAWRATRDLIATIGSAVITATASWFFVSTGWLAYFDSWLILALVLASFTQRAWCLLVTALLSPWIDERFVLALPICVAVRASGIGQLASDRRAWWRDASILAAGIFPYLAVRFGAEALHLRQTSISYWSDRPLLAASFGGTLWGVWNGLRLGWIPIALFAASFTGRSRGLLIAATSSTLFVNLCVADDLSRSMSVAIPLVLAGVMRLWQSQPDRARRIVPLLCVGNLLLPAHHVIAAPGNLEEPLLSVPILGLNSEIARSNDLPYFASPHAYNQRGLNSFQAGNHAKAQLRFELALRFDPNFSRARANLGAVMFLAGRRDEGMAELNAALARSPNLYEARFQRATFRQQLGNLKGALEDMRAALRHMPTNSPKRAEAEEFVRTVASQVES